jgi:hypothetical protein
MPIVQWPVPDMPRLERPPEKVAVADFYLDILPNQLLLFHTNFLDLETHDAASNAVDQPRIVNRGEFLDLLQRLARDT